MLQSMCTLSNILSWEEQERCNRGLFRSVICMHPKVMQTFELSGSCGVTPSAAFVPCLQQCVAYQISCLGAESVSAATSACASSPSINAMAGHAFNNSAGTTFRTAATRTTPAQDHAAQSVNAVLAQPRWCNEVPESVRGFSQSHTATAKISCLRQLHAVLVSIIFNFSPQTSFRTLMTKLHLHRSIRISFLGLASFHFHCILGSTQQFRIR